MDFRLYKDNVPVASGVHGDNLVVASFARVQPLVSQGRIVSADLPLLTDNYFNLCTLAAKCRQRVTTIALSVHLSVRLSVTTLFLISGKGSQPCRCLNKLLRTLQLCACVRWVNVNI